tara:strand:- start:15852 stop:16193 length:342 start_codon:yes stop_codon:yes gene_type:complete
VGHTPSLNRVLESPHQGVLSDQLIEVLRPIFPSENTVLIIFRHLCHIRSPIVGSLAVKKVEDWTNNPGKNSLRLLPSGSDRVGETPVYSPAFQVKYINTRTGFRKHDLLIIEN